MTLLDMLAIGVAELILIPIVVVVFGVLIIAIVAAATLAINLIIDIFF